MADEAKRAELIDRVWKLKLALQNEEGTYIHFKLCLDDPDYRRRVIDNALSSGNPLIRKQAQGIDRMDGGEVLIKRPARPAEVAADVPSFFNPAPEAAAPATSMPDPEPAAAPGAGGQRSGGVVLVVLLLLALAGGGAWYLGLHRSLPWDVPGLGGRTVVVSGSILENTVWRAGTEYRLDGLVFVESGARLTIEAGVRVAGLPGSALVVTRDGSITARGSAQDPVVFTSAQPVGERKSGDWGGVVLLGNAPINRGRAQIEGIEESDSRGSFGGSDPASNCGVLEYVRIEFAGFEIGANNELNGLTLGGCGEGTIVRYVQSHRGKDDGIEVFGGTVDLSHVVVTGASDDSFDWDMGWQGRVQFLAIQQYADAGDNGFEGDNWKDQPDAEPRSRPEFYNVTMVGSRNPEAGQRAMTIRRGSGGVFKNFVITGFPLESIDLRDAAVPTLIESGTLEFDDIVMFEIGAQGATFFVTEEGEEDDDGGFDELAYFSRAGANVLLGVDPLLGEQAFDIAEPWMVPQAQSPAVNGTPPRSGDEFWDEAADYIGAFRPGERVSWMDGWTAFPAD